ncbi:hypothetical protein FHT67_000555 [Paenibacillus sp. BK720]|nr:hypothetical protein [Paenibacillus sp. BK720]
MQTAHLNVGTVYMQAAYLNVGTVYMHTAHSNVLPIAITRGFLGTIPIGLESPLKSERFTSPESFKYSVASYLFFGGEKNEAVRF